MIKILINDVLDTFLTMSDPALIPAIRKCYMLLSPVTQDEVGIKSILTAYRNNCSKMSFFKSQQFSEI